MMRRCAAAVLAAVTVLYLSCETHGNQITFDRLTGLPPKFNLTCILLACSDIGDSDRISWSLNGSTVESSTTFSISREESITSTFTFCKSVLTVNGSEIGTYGCIYNISVPLEGAPSVAIATKFNVSGTLPPGNVIAEQTGPHSITVTWSAPPVTGFWITPNKYAVHYRCTHSSGDSDDGWTMEIRNGMTHTIRELQNVISCDIRLNSVSTAWLPSKLTDTVSVTLTGCTVISSLDPINSTSANISLMVEPPELVANGYNISLTGTEEPMCTHSPHTLPVVTISDSTHVLVDLKPYTAYTVTATGFNSNEGFLPATATFTTHSDAPSGYPQHLTAVAIGSTSISVQWSEVSCEDLNGELLGYIVQYNSTTGPLDSQSVMTSSHFAASEMLELTGLYPYTTYSLSVAVATQSSTSTHANHTGPYSPAVTVLTHEDLPGPVSSLSVSPLFTSLLVSWSEPTLSNGVITGYHINYQQVGGGGGGGGGERRTLNTSSTSSRVTHLQPGTEYMISVQASTEVGKGDAVELVKSTLPASRILSIKIEPVNSSSVIISWDDREIQEMAKVENAMILRYSIEYYIINSTTTEQSNISGNKPSGVIASLENGNVYHFQVSAVVDVEGKTYVFTGNTTATFNMTAPVGQSTAAIGGGVAMAMVAICIGTVLSLTVLVLLKKRSHHKSQETTQLSATAQTEMTSISSGVYSTVCKTVTNAVNHLTQEDDDLSEPKVTGFPQLLHVREGQSVCVSATVTGMPPPAISWYQDGVRLGEDETITIGRDGRLTIQAIEERHGGVYKMVVCNEAGSIEKEVCIEVITVEEAPIYGNLGTLRLVPVEQFSAYLKMTSENGNKAFREQYLSLADVGMNLSTTVAHTPPNKGLNRFKGLCAYDHTRVVLKPNMGSEMCQNDYINASYIDGYTHQKQFIATQGPLQKTVADFWRMVAQEGVTTIAMVTNLREGNKIKCHQYWPDSGTRTYSPFQVTLVDQQNFANHVTRTMRLHGSSDVPVIVTQFHFIAWPDHGVPLNSTTSLEFILRVRKHHSMSGGPLLVHCSAGVGRTGAFITIDIAMEQIRKEKAVDIAGIVSNLRKQRMKLVQTIEQFIFIHYVMLEYIVCGDTEISAAVFSAEKKRLSERDPLTHISGFERQFSLLDQLTPQQKEISSDTALYYADKNRSLDFLPTDKNLVPLQGEFPNYIHASFVTGYFQQNAFIVAEGPMESTCRNFWKMVYDWKCVAIAMLSDLVEYGEEVCVQYWPSETGIATVFDDVTVVMNRVSEEKGYILRELAVSYQENSHSVTQLQVVAWDTSGKSSDMYSILEVMAEVARLQMKSGNAPAVIHCSNTVGRSGVFCAMATCVEQCKIEGVVNVLRTVKNIRMRKPCAVLSVEQYCFIFDGIEQFLESFGNYANFATV